MTSSPCLKASPSPSRASDEGIACWWTIHRHDDNDADDNHDDASDDAGDDDSDDDGERGLHVGGPSSAVSGEQ